MASKGVESLSGKQLQCLELVGEGYTSAEIEGLLGISANTINTHISLAVQKLGAPNRMHAARILREHRLASERARDLPENMTSQILRLSSDRPIAPDLSRQGASSGDNAGPVMLSPIEPPAAPRVNRSTTDDLIAVLKIAALIIATAAGLAIILANYRSIVGAADDIYNAMPPTSITAH
jgi:DNA-binding CsgD family transcriptional regulator